MEIRHNRVALTLYFILAFIISWTIEVPIALSAQNILRISIPFWLHYLASFGPMLSAIIVVIITEGKKGIKDICSRLIRIKLQKQYICFILSPVIIFLGILFLDRAIVGKWPDIASLGQPDYLPYIGIIPTLMLWTITYGMGEEIGWRGFALPRLQKERSAISASIILGTFWAIWHLPAIFYRDTYIQMGLLVIPMLVMVAFIGSVVYTWFFNGTKGSLFGLIIFHGLFDFFSVWSGGVISPGMIMTILMIFWAVRIYKVYGGKNLSENEKVIV